MKKILAVAAVCAAVFSSCGLSRQNARTLKNQQMLETGVKNPATVEELRDAIEKYQKRVEDVASSVAQIGSWHRILGTRYIDLQMYGKALEEYQKAAEFYPANQNLFFRIGSCAGLVAKSALDDEAKRSEHLALAEKAFKRALELDPRHFESLYALGVLYVFDLRRPKDAIAPLALACEIRKQDSDAMMVLGRAHYENRDFDSAIAAFDKVISTTKSEKRKSEALANRQAVLDAAGR